MDLRGAPYKTPRISGTWLLLLAVLRLSFLERCSKDVAERSTRI
jgi:hypothetical protein